MCVCHVIKLKWNLFLLFFKLAVVVVVVVSGVFSINELLLSLQLRVTSCDGPDPRSYLDPVEVKWEISQGASLASLSKLVKDSLGLTSGGEMLLAKHFPDKFEWMMLNDSHGKEQVGVIMEKNRLVECIEATRWCYYGNCFLPRVIPPYVCIALVTSFLNFHFFPHLTCIGLNRPLFLVDIHVVICTGKSV